MPLTPAEKQRRYRERLKNNPDKYEDAKKKHRERYHKTKRLVKDLNPKERYAANVIWRLRKRESEKRKKALQNVIQNTPPSSPEPNFVENQNDTPPATPPPFVPPPATSPRVTPSSGPVASSAKERGRKKVKKQRSRLFRQNEQLKLENKELKRKYEKYKKRYQRTNETKTDIDKASKTAEDTKYKILSGAIKKTFKITKSRKEKATIKKIFTSSEIKDSRIKKKLLMDNLGVDKIITNTLSNKESKLKKIIKDFYNRDDISRATAGKKETITKNGTKVQKRFLLDSMKSLYKTFKKENPDLKCSYFYFAKNKPFYIVSASIDARDTCLCKIHANFAYKAKSVKKKGIIGTDDPNIIIESTVCCVNSKDCMYGTCEKCATKKYNYNIENLNGTVRWVEWVRKEETYEKDGRTIKAMKNVKEDLCEEADIFIQRFERDLAIFKRHVYNIKIQFKNFRRCVDHIQPNECIVVVDFSENYNCKYSEEIQSHHFGGSRKQISLHTVVVYTYNSESLKGYNVHSFCTISGSNNHQPAAIWSHLDPILIWIKSKLVNIDTIHFHSDGPSTQYRQKHNFYLMCTKIFDYGFCNMTWSFFETGHGKGPADGIGGFLKRSADTVVANGQDIADVEQFYERLKDASKIVLYLIDEKYIHEQQKLIPNNIRRLIGTLKVHQVFTDCYGIIKYRELGCFCEKGYNGKRGFCDCLNPGTYDLKSYCQTENEVVVVTDPDHTKDNDSSALNIPDMTTESITTYIPSLLKCEEVPTLLQWSSDDEEPLSAVQISKKIKDITNQRQSIYEEIYGPLSEEEPCTSYGKNLNIEAGNYLLVNVYLDKTRRKVYTYACKALSDMEEDGEVKVMFLKVKNEKATLFQTDDKDIAYVEYDDIIQHLPKPVMVKKGHKTYFEFKNSINVFEKK